MTGKKRTVGIITFHAAHNYGAVLQALGLQESLRSMGSAPTFINYNPPAFDHLNKRPVSFSSAKNALRSIGVMLTRKRLDQRYAAFETFIRNRLCLTTQIASEADLLANPPAFDTYICGSDQIWSPDHGMNPTYFLNFAPGEAQKLSYAASFGKKFIPENYIDFLKKFLEPFDAVSVREKSSEIFLKEKCGINAKTVLDPVFLPDISFWHHQAESTHSSLLPPEQYILFYSLQPNPIFSHVLSLLSKELKLPIVIVGRPTSVIFYRRTFICIEAGPAEFLNLVKNARLVITNSFHGTAFAILFNKPFYTVPHSTRNERIEYLLWLLDMSSREIKSENIDRNKLLEMAFNCPYVDTNQRLGILRETSLNFLRLNLGLN